MGSYVKAPLLASLAIAFLFSSPALLAGDPEAGKAKSVTCTACHGADGKSPMDLWPNLAGQKKGYLVKQMKAFRDGGRVDPAMSPMVANLSDEDIENLAAFYSALKP